MSVPSLYPSKPAIGRFNAWFFDTFDDFIDWSLRGLKRVVYQDLPNNIVEIGPGVGSNFRYYAPGTTVVAIEPNQRMHERLQRNAAAKGIDLVLKDTLAEDTGLPTGAAEVVISNLVLCTVTDPNAAVAEALRILAPGGRFLIVEHATGRGPLLRLIQRLVRRPWEWVFEGCDVSRDILEIVADAGFSQLALEAKTRLTLFFPVNSFVFGMAVK